MLMRLGDGEYFGLRGARGGEEEGVRVTDGIRGKRVGVLARVGFVQCELNVLEMDVILTNEIHSKYTMKDATTERCKCCVTSQQAK